MTIKNEVRRLAQKAKSAAEAVALLSASQKNKILLSVAREIRKKKNFIIAENKKDLACTRSAGLSGAMVDRLTLDAERIDGIASAVEDVVMLKDPIGRIIEKWKRPNGLSIQKVTVPLGVIVIIYESRPNVTSECASLCLKSGNSVILRGGREAFRSNKAIASIYQQILKSNKIPVEAVSLVETPDRSIIDELVQLEGLVNLVIPRGGEALIRRVMEKSRVPVIKHYKGICHVYVDQTADTKMAENIVMNAKVQRPGVCNAMETLLVHKKIAPVLLPHLAQKLIEKGVELRGDLETQKLVSGIKRANQKDWDTEYLDLILSIRVVDDTSQAIKHIQEHGSGHTDAIVTRSKKAAEEFVKKVDSSSVMVNASTRFADGNQYGFGAEIGISTDKVHARGPMGLEGLTSYKYIVRGKGQVRT
ncbi:MAG: glutamate-5-semialdehyde dehydrogenase [Candidatus Omnitrophica bacterium]|nr:glutamate-5-semialdehyde dehydrogenase [Candidatus Omnitrophota bacterium]